MTTKQPAVFAFAAIGLAGMMLMGFLLTSPPLPDDRIGFYGTWNTFYVPPDYSDSADRIAYEFGNQALFGKPEIIEMRPDTTSDLQVEPAPQYRLLGVAELDGRSVVLLTGGARATEKVAVGQATAEGWVVSQIGSSDATLNKNDQSIQLTFFQKAGP